MKTVARRGCLITAGGLAALAIGVPLLAALIYLTLRLAGAYLVVNATPQKSDVIVLLSGGSPQRTQEAVDLYHERYAQLLVITDTSDAMPDGTLVSDFTRMDLILRGVSPNEVKVTEHTVNNTRDEAQAVLHLMQIHHLQSCIVVTDPFHSRRTQLIFRDVFRGSDLSFQVVSARGHWYQSATWFLSLEGWSNTVREYVKLLAYWLSS
jgi:uncharacterized SAM-binding protein YcdF (DUF218 family)